ncbi:MAG: 1,4-alpha-glucan branching protein GlgB [Nitrospirae bacterium]|nr:1,4-alpha-glucan branching protein GlgB [Nitrospirota bacterium]
MFTVSSALTDLDLHLFNEGTHGRLYRKLGAHSINPRPDSGVRFAIWAPAAESVSVIGSFNQWKPNVHPLSAKGSSGIWEGTAEKAQKGDLYKFHVVPRGGVARFDKTDPFSFFTEQPPKTASIIWNLDYSWGDGEWMHGRGERTTRSKPVSIYEVHLGSWKRVAGEGHRSLSYREAAAQLSDYVKDTGFTHVEFLPLMEHPFFGSWGYQTTGYFAPSSYYGTPQDLMFLIDTLHRNGIGVILDWVPSHFPTDPHSLGEFDGTHLYEHADPRQGVHPDWNSYVFNYGRHEVRSFLLSSAIFWLDLYHADGLRVDAVASMLYRDYSRKDGEWIPHPTGGREDTDAIDFLRRLNETVYQEYPDVQMIAEESTAWPAVSHPTNTGGLGFGYKWDMGWMNDTLRYFSQDPVHRKHHHPKLTFRQLYSHSENFVLPLSHDEVTHGKGSLLGKMPGDDWQKFANLRLLLAWQFAQPGKKLLFMGGEIGQRSEWNHDGSIEWPLLQHAPHAGIGKWVRDLNRIYVTSPALHALDCDPAGFEWIECNDASSSVLAFLRRSADPGETVLAAFNFTPVVRTSFRVGVPFEGAWQETLNSDSTLYGGSGHGNMGQVTAMALPSHGRPFSVVLALPPLAAIFLSAPVPEHAPVR